MKISRARLTEIIQEELYKRAVMIYEIRYMGEDRLKEVHSEEQRNYMCAMADEDADRPKGLSQPEAKEMCTGPMKEAGRMRWDREITAAAQELGAPDGFVDLAIQALFSAAADQMDQAQRELAEALGMLVTVDRPGEPR